MEEWEVGLDGGNRLLKQIPWRIQSPGEVTLGHVQTAWPLHPLPFLCFSFKTIFTVVPPPPLGLKLLGMNSREELRTVDSVAPGGFLPIASPKHWSCECLCEQSEKRRGLRSRQLGCSHSKARWKKPYSVLHTFHQDWKVQRPQG